MISRWAWERKGRPHLLKETLPFVAVSIGAGVILTLASKFGNHVAMEMGLSGASRVLVADIFYFAANCLTFALRFVIFHFILFADRKAKVDTLAVVEGRAPVTDEPVESLMTHEPGRVQEPPADPARSDAARSDAPADAARSDAARADAARADAARFAEAVAASRVNGVSAWANGSAGPSAARHDETGGSPTQEHGTRR